MPVGGEIFDASIEYIRGCEERKARMLMMVIIPGEEFLAPGSCVGKRGEALRVVGLVLERLELRLGEGVVVADVRPAEAPRDAECAEELRESFGAHRGATVSVHDERAGLDAVARDGLAEELRGELRALALR